MARIWEGKYAGHFIVSEANVGSTGVARGREQIAIPAASPDLMSGQVVTVAAGGAITVYADGDTPAGIMYDNYPADAVNEQQGVILVTACEVNGAELEWDAALTNAQKLTAVAALGDIGIVVR